MIDLKRMRTRSGWSQMRLSKLAGVSRYRIHLAENAYIKLAKTELAKIKSAIRGMKGRRTKNV